MVQSIFPESTAGKVKILRAETAEELETGINRFLSDPSRRLAAPVRVSFGITELEPYAKVTWYATAHYYVVE